MKKNNRFTGSGLVYAPILVLMVLLLCSGFCASASAADDTVTVPAGAAIVIPADATALERTAADRLCLKLNELFSLSTEVTTAPDGRFEISVGRTDRVSDDMTAAPDGSYVIRAYPGGIALCGAGGRGNISAVYRFLEEYGGCMLLSPLTSVKTDETCVRFPADAYISYEPAFEFTQTDWNTPQKQEYSLFYGLTGGPNGRVPDEYGGYVEYIPRYSHTLATMFCSRDKYFKDHPEYFCLRNGKRNSDQLCLTNENVYQIVKSEVFAYLEEMHNPNVPLQVICLTQDDNRSFCQCNACKAVDDENGSHSGTMISFVNRIARDVAAAGYDNVAVDTFAYQYTQTPPSKVRPEPNVIVRLCSIDCCFSHPLNDPNCEVNRTFFSDLENWSAICNRLYIWNYGTNYNNTAGPFPNFGVLQTNVQCFLEHRVKGLFEAGNYYMDLCDTEFGELRSYLAAKLMQYPWCDYSALMNTFLQAYYGDAWREIRSYIDKTTENGAKSHLTIIEPMQTTFDFTATEIEQINEMWRRAEALSTGEQHAHVIRSELSWRYWKACVGASEFAGNSESANAARRQLMEDLAAHGTIWVHASDTDGLDDGFMYKPSAGTEDPEQPTSNCVCGEYHTGAFAWLIKLFHRIAYFFKNLFS